MMMMRRAQLLVLLCVWAAAAREDEDQAFVGLDADGKRLVLRGRGGDAGAVSIEGQLQNPHFDDLKASVSELQGRDAEQARQVDNVTSRLEDLRQQVERRATEQTTSAPSATMDVPSDMALYNASFLAQPPLATDHARSFFYCAWSVDSRLLTVSTNGECNGTFFHTFALAAGVYRISADGALRDDYYRERSYKYAVVGTWSATRSAHRAAVGRDAESRFFGKMVAINDGRAASIVVRVDEGMHLSGSLFENSVYCTLLEFGFSSTYMFNVAVERIGE